MEEESNTACSSQSLALIDPPNGPLRKRQKNAMFDTLGRCPSPLQNGGVFATMNRLAKLVEHHPTIHSRLERMLEDVFNELEPEISSAERKQKNEESAAIRKQKNEDSCQLYKLSNDELKLIFRYVGEDQYNFVACITCRFHQVYLTTFGGETFTSIENAAASVSCAAVCLHLEETDCDSHAESVFKTAAKEGKLDILMWGEDSGYELDTMLNCDIIVCAALNGHLEVVKYLRQLDIPWDEDTFRYAALSGHLELLKWARANQCPWDEDTCSNAARNGHLELLKWARANQCPWDKWTCTNAAENDRLELLKWAKVKWVSLGRRHIFTRRREWRSCFVAIFGR